VPLLEGHQRRRGDYTAVVIESFPVGLDRALQAELAAVRVDEHGAHTRSGLREAMYAPKYLTKLAAAVADVLSADPMLEGKITAYVQTHGVVMMLQLRGESVKVGHDNAAAKSEAAQEHMRLDPNLTTGGAVIKVGNENAAAKSAS
jgi:hypothetical protein